MRSEPLPDMPDTPPRFKKPSIDANTNLSPAGDVNSLLDIYRTALKNVADKLEAQGCASFTAASLVMPALPEKYPTPDVIPIDDDYVVIDSALSNVLNLPGRAFNMRRIAHKIKGLSHRGNGKGTLSSPASKAGHTAVSLFSSSKLLSRNILARS
jgi:hypothetical protein